MLKKKELILSVSTFAYESKLIDLEGMASRIAGDLVNTLTSVEKPSL